MNHICFRQLSFPSWKYAYLQITIKKHVSRHALPGHPSKRTLGRKPKEVLIVHHSCFTPRTLCNHGPKRERENQDDDASLKVDEPNIVGVRRKRRDLGSCTECGVSFTHLDPWRLSLDQTDLQSSDFRLSPVYPELVWEPAL